MVRRETAKFSEERCERYLAHFDEVVEKLKEEEAQHQPLPPEVAARIAGEDAPSVGPRDALVTIVEFSDFQCPYCARAMGVLRSIREEYGDRVRLVFRQFPLPFHQDAAPAARLALEAHAQGKFWTVQEMLYASQQDLSREQLERLAAEAGLNRSRVLRALNDKSYQQQLDIDWQLGRDAKVQGTPTLFVNGRRASNPGDYKVVTALIEEELASYTPEASP